MHKSFTVLSPNGRRNTVKKDQNDSVLSIIEEVCTKWSLESNRYELRHHGKILDASKSVIFCNLPNNAVLELMLSKTERQEYPITVCLQNENGHRASHDFIPTTSLWEVIMFFMKKPDSDLMENMEFSSNAIPSCIYLRKEISGEKDLKATSLRDLGLNKGKVMIRFVLKKQDENATLPVIEPIGSSKDSDSKLTVISNGPQNPSETLVNKDSIFSCSSRDNSSSNVFYSATDSSSVLKDIWNKEPVTMSHEEKSNADVKLIPLDDQGTLLYSLDSCDVPHTDVPDEFFELTVTDIKLMMDDLRSTRKNLEDRHLLTNAIREAQQLSRINQYKATLLRIYFPERLVLQCIFNSIATVGDVKTFLEKFVVHKKEEFYLYTTPPRKVLLDRERLFEVHCVPKAVIHYGSENNRGDNIKSEYKQKISSYKEASSAFDIDRLKRPHATQNNDSSGSYSEDKFYSAISVMSCSNVNSEVAVGESSQDKKQKPNPQDIPKWFMKGKR